MATHTHTLSRDRERERLYKVIEQLPPKKDPNNKYLDKERPYITHLQEVFHRTFVGGSVD